MDLTRNPPSKLAKARTDIRKFLQRLRKKLGTTQFPTRFYWRNGRIRIQQLHPTKGWRDEAHRVMQSGRFGQLVYVPHGFAFGELTGEVHA